MASAEILLEAANNLLEELGEDAQFSPNLQDDEETVRILQELDQHVSDGGGDERYQPQGFNERKLFISMLTSNFPDPFIPDQQVQLDGDFYSVERAEVDGPLVELELLKRDA